MIKDEPRSLVPNLGLEGYPSSLVAHPGEDVAVMLSGTTRTHIEVVRLIHGDPRSGGPGYVDEPADWFEPQTLDLSPQTIDYGSFVEAPIVAAASFEHGVSLGAWILPTLLNPGWNAIAAMWAPGDISFGLFTAGKTLVGGISEDGRSVDWVCAKEFVYLERWQFVMLVFDPQSGRASLFQRFMSSHPRATPQELVRSDQLLQARHLHRSQAPLHMGALSPLHEKQRGHWAHFNGRLSSPVLVDGALSDEEVFTLSDGEQTESQVIGRWDLSRQVASDRIEDVSGNGNHGTAINMPARAVTGPSYEHHRTYTREGSFSRRTSDYDAIHFHEDDLDDADWNAVAEVQVPANARSGIYSFKATAANESIILPFVVSSRTPTAPLVVLLPTFTWSAYASNRSPYSFTRDGVLDSGNSLYNVHTDQSPVYYVSRRRPTRTHDPRSGFEQRGAHKITANLYLIDWLEQGGDRYDIVTDDDLHHRGREALGDCRCLVVGSHPEYWSPQMLDALIEYLAHGGRVLYMGSEFLLWVATLDPERPYIMEVRKSEGGDYHPPVSRPLGEAEHSSAPVIGGAWSERGHLARNLVGVEVGAQAWFDVSLATTELGFRRTRESRDPEYSWVFAGVGEDPIGAYGLNLGSAAWMEMDSALSMEWLPGAQRVVLARASSDDFWTPRAEKPTGDLTLMTHQNGAAVLSAGSITWTGSLSHHDYANGVSQLTRNVIRRFVSTPLGRSVLTEETTEHLGRSVLTEETTEHLGRSVLTEETTEHRAP